jgi:hypothetical protein
MRRLDEFGVARIAKDEARSDTIGGYNFQVLIPTF